MTKIDEHQVAIAKLPKDERLYAAIGRFVVGFSNLEMILKLWIGETVRLPQEFHDQVLTHDFAMLCNLAQTVLPHDMKEGAGRALKPIISSFHELNMHRVRIVHGWWLGGSLGASHVSRQKLRAEYFYEAPSEIAVLADRAVELELELRDWYRTYALNR